jgi:hypothetical protein
MIPFVLNAILVIGRVIEIKRTHRRQEIREEMK